MEKLYKKTRVLVVDDSAYVRVAISRTVNGDSGVEVVGVAKDGIDAVEQTKKLRPDVVTMPRMDGLEALGRIMAECPTPVVMVSAQTGEQTHATIEALELGAVDFFLKESLSNPAGIGGAPDTLVRKVKTAAGVTRPRLSNGAGPRLANTPVSRPRPGAGLVMNRVVVIACSTGGPRALAHVIPKLPADIPAAILVVQHMPAGFTASLAERLNAISAIEVKEASEGDVIRPGRALIALGGYHLTVARTGEIGLNSAPPVAGVRPSADVTMEAVSREFLAASVGVVLTGMGRDGGMGTAKIKAVGGRVIAEDESTSVVFGMPGNVIKAGNADTVVPIDMVAATIAEICAVRA